MAGSPSRSIPRSPTARKGKTSVTSRRTGKPSLLGRVIARPGVIVAGATFAAVMTGIVANAVLFQKGHHPSPLFGAAPSQSITEPARLAPPPPIPLPVPRPALDTQTTPETEAPPAPVAAPSPPMPLHPVHTVSKSVKHAAPAHKTAAAPQSHKDLIGQLIGKTEGKSE